MPTADHRTDTELVMAHRQASDQAAREALILRYSGLARAIARRFARRGLPYDDIVQSGYLGLIQAVDRYEPSRGVPLQAYAARTIEGEIMHLFRDRGWAVRVPRSLQELSRSIAVVSEQLGHRLGRKPTVAELAEASGHSEQEVDEAGFVDVRDRDEVSSALRHLPPREREIVRLRFVSDMTQSEIAAEMGISQMHVSRLLRA